MSDTLISVLFPIFFYSYEVNVCSIPVLHSYAFRKNPPLNLYDFGRTLIDVIFISLCQSERVLFLTNFVIFHTLVPVVICAGLKAIFV